MSRIIRGLSAATTLAMRWRYGHKSRLIHLIPPRRWTSPRVGRSLTRPVPVGNLHTDVSVRPLRLASTSNISISPITGGKQHYTACHCLLSEFNRVCYLDVAQKMTVTYRSKATPGAGEIGQRRTRCQRIRPPQNLYIYHTTTRNEWEWMRMQMFNV